MPIVSCNMSVSVDGFISGPGHLDAGVNRIDLEPRCLLRPATVARFDLAARRLSSRHWGDRRGERLEPPCRAIVADELHADTDIRRCRCWCVETKIGAADIGGVQDS